MMNKVLLKAYRSLPGLQKKYRSVKHSLKKRGFFNPFLRYVPPGHYNSPLLSYPEILKKKKLIVDDKPKNCPGIDLKDEAQLNLLKRFSKYKGDFPFPNHQENDCRYYYDNNFFSKSDARVLNATMREFKPSNIIEIGSGFSSALMLDTNDIALDKTVNFTFIEPFPHRLNGLLSHIDRKKTFIIEKFVQDVDLEVFDKLEKDDILFVDSSHVIKVGSDLSFIFFSILPRLKPGVIIHFHDILWPFEYPLKWYFQGRAYNEAYALRTFLQFNETFEILFFPSYLYDFHQKALKNNLPISLENEGGGSIYIRKK